MTLMAESHCSKATWLLGNRGPGYIRYGPGPQPHRIKIVNETKIPRIDLTFIFPSFIRHTKQIVNNSKLLILAGLFSFEPASQHDARSNITIVCYQIHSPQDNISASFKIIRPNGSFEIGNLLIHRHPLLFHFRRKGCEFSNYHTHGICQFFLMFSRGHIEESGRLIDCGRKLYFVSEQH
ncbi:MAG: hypothetical protein H6Q41_848 [Deltaproteobacteria bacterium]|nr:hypothetical protein [Deltaproteobacteria bacterium]